MRLRCINAAAISALSPNIVLCICISHFVCQHDRRYNVLVRSISNASFVNLARGSRVQQFRNANAVLGQ